MNVWFVNHYALPPSSTGIVRHHHLAKRLIARGHHVSIVASGFDHYSRSQRGGDQLFTTEVLDGVDYCWVLTPEYGNSTKDRSLNMITFASNLWRKGTQIRLPRPDVIVGSSPHLLTPLAARHLAKMLASEFVLEVRDIWPESLVELGGPPRWHPAIRALRAVEKSLYRTAHGIVSVLPAADQHIQRSAGRRVNVTWIPNGSEVPKEAPRAPFVGSTFDVMYSGTIGHANSLDVIVEAAAILERDDPQSRIRWRIVGLGPDRERLEKKAADLGLSSVCFEGPVPSSEVPSVLATADVCLLHLMDSPVFRWGVSPNKLFDYMRAARPVIYAVRAGNDPVADASCGVSINPADPAALAEAAQKLEATDPSELRNMGLNGFAYLKANHDLEVLTDRYVQVFEKAVKPR